MEQKVKLERDTYETVKSMLESDDIESRILGLECIKNGDSKTNLVYSLLLLKETNLDLTLWEANIPDFIKILRAVCKGTLSHGFITYKRILEIMAEYELPEEDYNFFGQRYALFIKNQDEKGRIKSVEIKIKLNENV